MKLLKFIRLPNLMIIAITQALIYFGLISPALSRQDISSDIGTLGLFILSSITIIIALGGYIINDIFDIHTDLINKPEKKFINNYLSIKKARILYVSIFVTGFVLSTWYALDKKVLHLLFVYPLSVAILAFYSYRLKNTLLTGNIIVSLFSAFVAGILLIFDWSPLMELKNISAVSFTALSSILFAFIGFAFLSSLFREIIKDLEDIKGDEENSMRTTAVRLGPGLTKAIAFIAGLLLLLSIILWSFHSINQMNLWLQMYGLLLAVYNFVILIKLYLSKRVEEIGAVSNSIKLLMAAGLLYILIYCFILYI